jgi:cell division protein FtsI (penicillin-binding protein 3)
MVHQYYSKNPQAFVDRVKSFGLGMKLDLQIAGEGRPFIKNTDHELWSKVSLPYMSIGYECSLTPLQILTFYNAVANNGRMMKPYFVKEIRNKGHLVKKYAPQVIKDSIASPTTLAWARSMLEGVVQTGTATNLRHAQYKIAGKTGTAQIANAKDGYKNGKVRYQASFVGYFPADNPKYSCIVVVYAPNGNVYYASQVAGPIFKEIADKVYASSIELHRELRHEQLLAMNVPAVKKGTYLQTETVARELDIPVSASNGSERWVVASKSGEKLMLKGMNIRHDQVPDVHGMGLRDAVYILESLGLRVRIVGRGQVVAQSVKPGTTTSKGMEITLTLGS